MKEKITLNQYSNFVEEITSDASNNTDVLVNRIKELAESNPNINIALLLTASDGLCSETGELKEIVKKMLFQGKPLTEDNIKHMILELSDVIWYWVNGCRALNIDPYDIIQLNVDKLCARYPQGKFDAHFSENRREGDRS